MNLLLLEASEISADGEAVVTGARATHVREVLRAEVGKALRVGQIDGATGTAEVLQLDSERVTLRVELRGEPPPTPRVDLLLALPRPKVLKRLYAQLAAIGVGQLFLTNASRVERYYFDSHAVREAVWRSHLLEGLSQARDTRVPRVEVFKSLKRAVEDVVPQRCTDARWLLADPAYQRSPYDVARRSRDRRVLVALGPEGGWTAYERDLFQRQGFVGVGLGPRTLRSDTATVALLSLIHAGLDSAPS